MAQPPSKIDPSIPESELTKLSPDARAKVQEALKASAEGSLLSVKAAEFSRGWVFGRSRPKPEVANEERIMQHAASMDQETFAKFAANLAALKSKTGSGGSGG